MTTPQTEFELYVETDGDESSLAQVVQAIFRQACEHRHIRFELEIYRNPAFEQVQPKNDTYSFVESCRFIIDCALLENLVDHTPAIVDITFNLRDYYDVVVLAGGPEDVVIERTGWNWTEHTRRPQ